MRALVVMLCLVAAACGGSKKSMGKKAKMAPRETKCLPVVQERCGCVYACSSGYRDPDIDHGRWHVTTRAWEGKDVRAAVMNWCGAGEECTPAFSAEVACGKQCTPSPGDRTCHFDEDKKCVTGAPPPPAPPAANP
jgi:hypothetical protein